MRHALRSRNHSSSKGEILGRSTATHEQPDGCPTRLLYPPTARYRPFPKERDHAPTARAPMQQKNINPARPGERKPRPEHRNLSLRCAPELKPHFPPVQKETWPKGRGNAELASRLQF